MSPWASSPCGVAHSSHHLILWIDRTILCRKSCNLAAANSAAISSATCSQVTERRQSVSRYLMRAFCAIPGLPIDGTPGNARTVLLCSGIGAYLQACARVRILASAALLSIVHRVSVSYPPRSDRREQQRNRNHGKPAFPRAVHGRIVALVGGVAHVQTHGQISFPGSPLRDCTAAGELVWAISAGLRKTSACVIRSMFSSIS